MLSWILGTFLHILEIFPLLKEFETLFACVNFSYYSHAHFYKLFTMSKQPYKRKVLLFYDNLLVPIMLFFLTAKSKVWRANKYLCLHVHAMFFFPMQVHYAIHQVLLACPCVPLFGAIISVCRELVLFSYHVAFPLCWLVFPFFSCYLFVF